MPSTVQYYKGKDNSETYYAPDMATYLANPASIEVAFNDTDMEYNVDFVYDALDLTTDSQSSD